MRGHRRFDGEQFELKRSWQTVLSSAAIPYRLVSDSNKLPGHVRSSLQGEGQALRDIARTAI